MVMAGVLNELVNIWLHGLEHNEFTLDNVVVDFDQLDELVPQIEDDKKKAKNQKIKEPYQFKMFQRALLTSPTLRNRRLRATANGGCANARSVCQVADPSWVSLGQPEVFRFLEVFGFLDVFMFLKVFRFLEVFRFLDVFKFLMVFRFLEPGWVCLGQPGPAWVSLGRSRHVGR